MPWLTGWRIASPTCSRAQQDRGITVGCRFIAASIIGRSSNSAGKAGFPRIWHRHFAVSLPSWPKCRDGDTRPTTIPRHASQSETQSPSSQALTGCFWISRKQPRPKNARLPSTFSSRNDLARSDPAEGRLAARSPPTYSRNAPITCARTATAISSGVRAPIGRPTGPWIRSRSAAAKPSAPRRSRLAPWVLRLPSAPM